MRYKGSRGEGAAKEVPVSDDKAKRKWWDCRRRERKVRVGGHIEQDGTANVSLSLDADNPFIVVFVSLKATEARELAADLLAAADFAEGKS